MQLLKDVVLNISMYDLLYGVPKYENFIKDLLSGKRGEKLNDIIIVSKNCRYIIKKELIVLEKKGNLGVPTILVHIGEMRFTKALCNLGFDVSLMPLSIARSLGLTKELKYTLIALQLLDKSIVFPDGIVKDVLV